MKIVDETFNWGELAYKNAALLKKSKCRLRIYRHSDVTTVIITELPENEGRSVTNDAEKIINLACQKHELCFKYVVWVEHYTYNPPCEMRGEESFDLVKLTAQGSPVWEPIRTEKLKELIGEDPSLKNT